ncbi:MAG: DEAD/DEAH box helicase [Proteobacteria bacterium]|nr:DEAD/DEAH box helicase [Pseudomonadota bacterium]
MMSIESNNIWLKDYQEKVVLDTIEALKLNQRVVVACPTGSGKTVIALHGLLQKLIGKTAWVTHRRELAKQVRDYRQGVDVFMAQSAVSGDYENIIIDEGHHVAAAQYRRILADYSRSKIIALTATPYRLDGVGLGSCGFSKIIHGPDIFELTENGTICPVRVFIPRSEKTSAWSPMAASERITEAGFNKGIVYCRSVKEAAELAEILTEKGITAASIDGSTNQKSRETFFDEFVNGGIKILCNHTIFTEGTDVPCVDLVVLNRYTHSRCLWKQMIGRGTRKAEGKSVCTILDLAGNGVLHGSIYDREIYDLNGKVDSIESRTLNIQKTDETKNYEHNEGEELKEWKPQPKPISIIESLQRLKLKSPLHRLKTA